MQENELQLLNRVRLFSSLSVLLVILLSLIFVDPLAESSMGWQVALAVGALAIGIPHGALDHLVTMPKAQPLKMSIFVIVYVGVAALAVIAILTFNTVGFIAVAGVLTLGGQSFTDEFFWMALVVVWALTLPHMIVTAQLDRAALV